MPLTDSCSSVGHTEWPGNLSRAALPKFPVPPPRPLCDYHCKFWKSSRSIFESQFQLGFRIIIRASTCLPCHSYILLAFHLPLAHSFSRDVPVSFSGDISTSFYLGIPLYLSSSHCLSAIHQPMVLLQLLLASWQYVSQSLILKGTERK